MLVRASLGMANPGGLLAHAHAFKEEDGCEQKIETPAISEMFLGIKPYLCRLALDSGKRGDVEPPTQCHPSPMAMVKDQTVSPIPGQRCCLLPLSKSSVATVTRSQTLHVVKLPFMYWHLSNLCYVRSSVVAGRRKDLHWGFQKGNQIIRGPIQHPSILISTPIKALQSGSRPAVRSIAHQLSMYYASPVS